jgi:hypothetical protein
MNPQPNEYELVMQARRATWSLGGVVILEEQISGRFSFYTQVLKALGEDSTVKPRPPLPDRKQVTDAYDEMGSIEPDEALLEEHPDMRVLIVAASDAIRYLYANRELLPEPNSG